MKKKDKKINFGKLGKFYIDPSENNGFLRGPNFQYKTQAYCNKCHFNGLPATVCRIFLGVEDGERLNHDLVPDDTEAVFCYNLEDGTERQVIHYLHLFKKHEDAAHPDSLNLVLRPFSNSFRKKDERLGLKSFFCY